MRTRRRMWRGQGWICAVCACTAVVVAIATPLSADVFHLKSGGAIEGELIEQTDAGYRVRTKIGVMTLAQGDVVRIEPTESPFAELDRRRAATPDDADALVAFAAWCRENDFKADARKALLRAIKLDPDHAEARAALGFVRVGEVWVENRTPASRPTTTRPARRPDAAQARVRRARLSWARRIASIRDNMLESGIKRVVADGRRRIVEITDPLAILPLVEKLSDGPFAARDALVEVLGKFPQDEATMNLAALALVDPDRGIRRRALAALARRNDPRVVAQFREALKTDDEFVIRNAAEGLGVFGDPAAIPELIDALHVRRVKTVEVPTQDYFGGMVQTFSGSTQVTFGASESVELTPTLGVASRYTQPGYYETPRLRRGEVTVYRTEVMEALKAITGVNFGFDAEKWRRWYEEERP